MADLRLIPLLALLLTGMSAPLRAQPPGAHGSEPAALSVVAAQSDFDLLRHALEEAHPGLYRYSSKAEMDRLFTSERGKLNQPMTRMRFREVVAETLAGMRCGHTSLGGDAEMDAA